jgi:hypothetical protein
MLNFLIYIISKIKLNLLILFISTILFSACKNKYNDNKLSLPCLPYSISNKKSSKTITLENFGRLESKVHADIVYHRLPNPTDKPYLVIEGHSDIINRISCETKYSNSANQNDLIIYYSKCIRVNRVVKIHLYCKELFVVSIYDGTFLTEDTLYSNVGWLSFATKVKGHVEAICNVNTLNIIQREGQFTLHGVVQICSLTVQGTGERFSAPIHPTNLRNLDYQVLELYVESGNDYIDGNKRTPIYVGSPDTIYYNIQDNKQYIYYQGNPVLISKNSPNFTLTHEP